MGLFFKNLIQNIKFYFKNIDIHGLCTIFRSNSWSQLIFWFIIFILAFQHFCNLIVRNMIEFNNQPITKSIATTTYPVNLIPFPAVTVCNFNIVYKPFVGKFIKMLINNGVNKTIAESFLRNLALLRDPVPIDFNVEKYKEVYETLEKIGYKDTEWMLELAQPCDKILRICYWEEKSFNCSAEFKMIKGDLGYCCSFNTNFKQKKKDRFTTAGPTNGLYLGLNIEIDKYVSATYNVSGILILVHNKDAYANADTVFYSVVQPGKEVTMRITPDIFQSDISLKQMNINSRQCWFSKEGIKMENASYNIENCLHICKTETIGNVCGCVPYYHLHTGGWRTCTFLDYHCLLKNLDYYSALHLKINLPNNKNDVICNCLQACNGINYRGNIESLYYRNKSGDILTDYSAARIIFQNNWCKKYIRNRATTIPSFIASFGGYFSLCVGGSIVSIVELLFYFIKSIFSKSKFEEPFQPQLYWSEFQHNIFY